MFTGSTMMLTTSRIGRCHSGIAQFLSIHHSRDPAGSTVGETLNWRGVTNPFETGDVRHYI